jgi:hypothetical protein
MENPEIQRVVSEYKREVESRDYRTYVPESGSQIPGFPERCGLTTAWYAFFLPLVATPQLATETLQWLLLRLYGSEYQKLSTEEANAQAKSVIDALVEKQQSDPRFFAQIDNDKWLPHLKPSLINNIKISFYNPFDAWMCIEGERTDLSDEVITGLFHLLNQTCNVDKSIHSWFWFRERPRLVRLLLQHSNFMYLSRPCAKIVCVHGHELKGQDEHNCYQWCTPTQFHPCHGRLQRYINGCDD